MALSILLYVTLDSFESWYKVHLLHTDFGYPFNTSIY
jgi:hypothetical protein